MKRYLPVFLLSAAGLLSACAGTPETGADMVAQAEPKCKIAPADPAVVKKEPSELDQRYAQMQLHSMPYYRKQQAKPLPNTLQDIDRDCR